MVAVSNNNPFLPYLGTVIDIKDLATDILLFRIEMLNGGKEAFCDYKPGQFVFLSAFGLGEAPFGIASSATRGDTLDFAVQRLGSVTTGLHELGKGDPVGIRGPLGNWFPMDQFKEKNLVIIGGGIGGAPLRPVIHEVLDHRADYGHLMILWAARNPSLLVFTDEYEEWKSAPDTELHLTVDQPDQLWDHNVGLITQLLEKVSPSPDNAISITCGPPIMIHHVEKLLRKLGFKPERIYVTLEARMHCGIGKCGRCNLGEKLICIDGPVFTVAEIGEMLENYL